MAPADPSARGSQKGIAETAANAELTQFISFAIGDDQYGVAIMAVREIKG